MDTTAVETFLDVIFGSHEGIVAFGLITGNNPENPRAIDNSFYWQWPNDRSDVLTFVKRHHREDVYLSPMLYADRQRKQEYVSTTPVIWCDADAVSPDNFELPPTLALETSAGSWQCFWVLTDEVTPVWASRMSKLVAYRHRDEGAGYEGWQLSKYLRIPSTMNTKPTLAEPWEVQLSGSGRVYESTEFVQVFGDPGTNGHVLVNPLDHPLPKNLPSRGDVLAKLAPDEDITRMLYETPLGKSWNERLWALECTLFRKGLTRAEVFVMVHGCACDKYTRDDRPETDLWTELGRAEIAAPSYVSSRATGLITDDNVDTYSPPPVERPSFLTDEERLTVTEYPTFIERYRDWGITRTEADPRYHEFGAMCLMSTVLSDYGHAVPRFGNMRLNMWFMLLGVTTRTYKTTSRKLMLEILNPLNNLDDGYDYKVGSDATPEALIVELHKHPNRSVLFFRDEVSGMFGDMRGGRGYMSGLSETMTELYDGHVHGRLRSTGTTKRTPEVDISFNMYLMGVPGKVAEILNADDFATGFLARFLYVVGEPGARTPASMYLAQQPEEYTKLVDPVAQALRQELSDVRYRWSQRTTAGDTVAIRVDADAWERYNSFIRDMTELAAADPQGEILEPSSDRLNKSVLKLACLLAMMDNCDVASLHHMLRAIWYCEGWYMSMVQMSHMIQTSEWSAKVDKLVAYVAQHEHVLYESAYRKFREMRAKDFAELVASAIEAGLLVPREGEDRRRWLSV